MAVVAEHSTDELANPVREGGEPRPKEPALSAAEGTHCREGEAGHNVLLKGNIGDTLRSQTVSTKLQRIAKQARAYPERVLNNKSSCVIS